MSSSNIANIYTGINPNDGTGDSVRLAFGKINNNFSNVSNTGIVDTLLRFGSNNAITSQTGIDLTQIGNSTQQVRLPTSSKLNIPGASQLNQFLQAGTAGNVYWGNGAEGSTYNVQFKSNQGGFQGSNAFSFDPVAASLNIQGTVNSTSITSGIANLSSLTVSGVAYLPNYVLGNGTIRSFDQLNIGNKFLVLSANAGNSTNAVSANTIDGSGIQIGNNIWANQGGNVTILFNSTSNTVQFNREISTPSFNSGSGNVGPSSTSFTVTGELTTDTLTVNTIAAINDLQVFNSLTTTNSSVNFLNYKQADNIGNIGANGILAGGTIVRLENLANTGAGYVGIVLATNTANGGNRNGEWNLNTSAIDGNLNFNSSYTNASVGVANSLITFSKDGNVSANYFFGNGAFLTGITGGGGSNYSNANVAVYLPNYSGNVGASYFLGNGRFLTGLPEAYSNANVANYLPVYGGNILAGNIQANANISANTFIGQGAGNLTISSENGISLITGAGNGTVAIAGSLQANGLTSNTSINSPRVTVGTVDINTGNITGVSNISVGNVQVSANITANGTIVAYGNMTAVGNVTGNYFLGNGAFLTGISSGTGNYSNSNVANYLPTYTGNLVALTGNVTTTANVSGNYILGNGAFLTGIVTGTNYSNSNVANYLPTYTGNLVALTGNVTTTANVTAQYLLGNGRFLTGIAGGANLQVQYNLNNNLVGNSYFTVNPVTSAVNIGSSTLLGLANLGNYSPTTAGTVFTDVYYTGSGYVATFANTGFANPYKFQIINSTDGITWSQTSNSGLPTFGRTSGDPNGLRSIYAGNNIFIFVPDRIYSFSPLVNVYRANSSSISSLAFSAVALPSVPGNFYTMGYIASDNTGNVIFGQYNTYIGTNNYYRSTDYGATWSLRTFSATVNSGYWQAAAYGNGLWIIVGNFAAGSVIPPPPRERYQTSPDGITWTERVGPMASGPGNNGQMVIFYEATIGLWFHWAYGSTAVAFNTTSYYTSPDGITWTTRTFPGTTAGNWVPLGSSTGVVGVLNTLTGNTNSGAYYTTDGINWASKTFDVGTTPPLGDTAGIPGTAYTVNAPRLVSVAYTGSAITATVSSANATSNLNISGGLLLNNAAGSNGQVLTSQGAGQSPVWATLPSTYSNANVAAYLPTYTGNLSPGNLIIANTGNIQISGGSNGQVLTTSGNGILYWNTPSSNGGSGGGGGGGPANSVQFNSGNANAVNITGSNNFIFTDNVGNLDVTGLRGAIRGVALVSTGVGVPTITSASSILLNAGGGNGSVQIVGGLRLANVGNLSIPGGSNGQALITYGNGVAYWGNVAAGGSGGATPSGPNTAVQFNANNTLGGTTALTFDRASNVLTVGGTLAATQANVQTVNATGNVNATGATLSSALTVAGSLATYNSVTSTGTIPGLNESDAPTAIVYGNGYYLSYGYYNDRGTRYRIQYSTNGTSWTGYNTPTSGFSGTSNELNDFVYEANSRRFIAVEPGVSGLSWTTSNSPFSWTSVSTSFEIQKIAVSRDGASSTIVALTTTGQLYYTDATGNFSSWTQITFTGTAKAVAWSGFNNNWNWIVVLEQSSVSKTGVIFEGSSSLSFIENATGLPTTTQSYYSSFVIQNNTSSAVFMLGLINGTIYTGTGSDWDFALYTSWQQPAGFTGPTSGSTGYSITCRDGTFGIAGAPAQSGNPNPTIYISPDGTNFTSVTLAGLSTGVQYWRSIINGATGFTALSSTSSATTGLGFYSAQGVVNILSGLVLNGNSGSNGQVLTSQGPGASPIWTSGTGALIGYSGGFQNLTGNVTTTANVQASYFLGNGRFLTGISGGNVDLANYVGNVGGNIQFNQFREANVQGGNVSGNVIPNAAAGTIYTYTLIGNITLNTISNVQPGTSMTIILQQDAIGNRRLTSTTWLFASGVKILSTGGGNTDIISVFYSGSQYYASLTRGFV